ncbi:MAG: chitobiase/beta-hexosaminidase C-terminal domain-containing protein [Chthoniobacterales bacterium]
MQIAAISPKIRRQTVAFVPIDGIDIPPRRIGPAYMKSHSFLKTLALLPVLMPALAFAATYTEGGNGDLSGNRAAPTTFTLSAAAGANTLTATTVAGDEDYVKIVVPNMFNLQSIILTAYDNTTAKSFIAFQTGATFTETVAAPNPANMNGYCHFGGVNSGAQTVLGGNLLANMKNGIPGNGAPIGYTIPLAGNTSYTFWLHETSATARTYTLTFNVQSNASVNAPVIAPITGSFADSTQISISTTTGNSTIYYTTDGSTPTTASTPYSGAFTIKSSQTIKAFAHDNANTLTDSSVTTETFTIIPTPAPTVTVSGSKSIKTTKLSVKIKGTATNATSVTYKVGKGPKKTAAGTSAWSFNAKLKAGSKNVITITVTGINGTATAKVTVTVKKK